MKEVKNIGVPVVITRTPDGETLHQDIYSRLLKDRIVMIDGEIEPHMASVVVAELLFLQSEDPTAPINLYIASPGGSVTAGMSIIDTMNLVKPPVYTFSHGSIASMGSVIASAGDKGHRYILEHTQTMIHQVSSGSQGNVQDMEVSMNETRRINTVAMTLLANNCGKTLEELLKDTERDKFMDAEQAIAYGLVDEIIKK